MTDIVTIKRGATFRFRVGLPADLRPAVFKGQVRAMGSDRLVGDLAVRCLDLDSAVVLELEAPTGTWPISNLSADILAIFGGEVVYSETIHIRVVRNVTV